MKHSFSFLIVFTILFPWFGSSMYCNNFSLRDVSLKSFCVRDNGQTVNCRGNLYKVNKAYVVCETGYYNKANVSLQILDCIDNRKWSGKVMRCYPNCVESPQKDGIKLIENDNSKIPEWYAELIQKKPRKGNVTKFPGLILNAGIIVITGEFFDFNLESISEYFVRIYRNRLEFTDYGISHISDRNEFYIVHLNCYNYIKFNENIKPICPDSKAAIPYKNFLDVILEQPTRDCPKCLADYNDPKMEVLCFKNEKNRKFFQIDCSPESDFILTRCRLGYQYIKPNDRDYLSYCQRRYWQYRDNECQLICGEIDKDYDEVTNEKAQNGDKTEITSVPWHAGIFTNIWEPSGQFEQICGGTIIHSNIIISAAHCFYNWVHSELYDASNYIVGVGKKYRNYTSVEEHSFYTNIRHIHVAQTYHHEEVLSDIAVVVLQDNLIYSPHIRPACLDFSRQYKLNEIQGFIAGWGPNSKDKNQNGELWTSTLTIITNEQCKSIVSSKFLSQISGDKFCAINKRAPIPCRGDSGSGFIVKKNIGFGERYYLTGILTTGVDRTKLCTDEFIPQFTNIEFSQNFIKDIILENRNFQFSKNYNQLFKLS